MAGQPRNTATKPAKSLEQRLWDTADALRGNQEPSEYKHIVLGLVFLKYISDRFEVRRQSKDAVADCKEPTLKSLHNQQVIGLPLKSPTGFPIVQPRNGFLQQAMATLTTIQGFTRRETGQDYLLIGAFHKAQGVTVSAVRRQP